MSNDEWTEKTIKKILDKDFPDLKELIKQLHDAYVIDDSLLIYDVYKRINEYIEERTCQMKN